MRVLAMVLACLANTGHGRRKTSRVPVHQAGLPRRVGERESRDSFAYLLGVRGGKASIDDTRGGFGESLPMTPSRGAIRTTGMAVEAADIGAASGARMPVISQRPRRGSAGRARDKIDKSALKTWSYRSSPVHYRQAGSPRRVGERESRDSFAYLLGVRGGTSSIDDTRGGFGASLPMTPSRGAIRTTGVAVEAADIGAASGARMPVISQRPRRGSTGRTRENIDKTGAVLVQGGSLKTWSYRSSLVDHVQVVLTTDGRPLDADVQLWQGPDNTPCKMRVYSEDGDTRPFSAVIATPYGGENTVAIYNVGQIEFPLAAYVTGNDIDEPISDFRDTSIIVQGGALRTFNFDTSVESVEIMLKTDGRPLNARVEMLQGPNNNKQVIELYTEDGLERPFFAVINTMGSGNVVRVVNTAPMEFPMTASVQPHSINTKMSPTDPVIGDGRSFQ